MSENIGTKIKQLRKELNLSLEEIAGGAGVEVSQMSLIEDGVATPSISTLIKISRTLGVRVGTLLDGSEESGPVVSSSAGDLTINRANNIGSSQDNLNFNFLAASKKDRNMDPYIVNVVYHNSPADKGSVHEGEEFLYVLQGEVEVRYGKESYRLSTGDSIYYDSIVPHVITTTSPEAKAKVLAVTYTPY